MHNHQLTQDHLPTLVMTADLYRICISVTFPKHVICSIYLGKLLSHAKPKAACWSEIWVEFLCLGGRRFEITWRTSLNLERSARNVAVPLVLLTGISQYLGPFMRNDAKHRCYDTVISFMQCYFIMHTCQLISRPSKTWNRFVIKKETQSVDFK